MCIRDRIEDKSRKQPTKFVVGCSNFKTFLYSYETYDCYIDKTLFISEFPSHTSTCVCILRPRRSGKSLNLSMLDDFLGYGADSEAYMKLKIGKIHPELIRDHCGKYPVIKLDFKDCRANTWDEMYKEICSVIAYMVLSHKSLLQNVSESNVYVKIICDLCYEIPKDPMVIKDSLKHLMRA